jgi:hypothetical protein
MTCYICSNPAGHSVRVHDSVTFSYCDDHISEVVIGISEFVLKGTLDKLEASKEAYMSKYKGSAYNEFVRCQGILDSWSDNDSSVTEQAI